MFTFGREHERNCSIRYVRSESQQKLAMGVVDAVHDLIEGISSEASTIATLKTAFSDGGSGVWEQTGSWLRQLGEEYPNTQLLWKELAVDKRATVRFRVACLLNDLSPALRAELLPLLITDRNKKVAEMAAARSAEP